MTEPRYLHLYVGEHNTVRAITSPYREFKGQPKRHLASYQLWSDHTLTRIEPISDKRRAS